MFLAVALLPPLWHFRQSARAATAQAAELHAQLLPGRALAERNASNLAIIAAKQERLAAIQKALAARSSWVEFLAELQQRLTNVEDVWLEQLVVLPAPPPSSDTAHRAAATQPSIQLKLSGRLLDVRNPVANVSRESYERVKQLLAGLADSRFVAAVQDERFDHSQTGLLRFDCVLALDPRRSL